MSLSLLLPDSRLNVCDSFSIIYDYLSLYSLFHYITHCKSYHMYYPTSSVYNVLRSSFTYSIFSPHLPAGSPSPTLHSTW